MGLVEKILNRLGFKTSQEKKGQKPEIVKRNKKLLEIREEINNQLTKSTGVRNE